ncbi:MAG: hypothetical protein LKI28_07235 [Ancrocorticia sp.]|nr:hypothetical protein [Ancrocorticia sp.]
MRESPSTVSLWLQPRRRPRVFPAAPSLPTPGQFVTLRFYRAGLAWEGHSFSVSGVRPDGSFRVTVRVLGDATALIQDLPAGTAALVEGPYGVMTASRAQEDRAVLIAGGIGISPIRGIAGDLAGRTRLDVIVRARSADDLPLVNELRALEQQNLLRLHLMVGSRRQWPIDPYTLGALIPDFAHCDVYACGPAQLLDAVRASAAAFRVPDSRVHIESLDL